MVYDSSSLKANIIQSSFRLLIDQIPIEAMIIDYY